MLADMAGNEPPPDIVTATRSEADNQVDILAGSYACGRLRHRAASGQESGRHCGEQRHGKRDASSCGYAVRLHRDSPHITFLA
jgi:hypothetical protein